MRRVEEKERARHRRASRAVALSEGIYCANSEIAECAPMQFNNSSVLEEEGVKVSRDGALD